MTTPYPPLPHDRVRLEVMRMWWRDLTFVHLDYEPAIVQALLPDDLVVDTWPDADGRERAWVGLVPFEMVVATRWRRPASRNRRASPSSTGHREPRCASDHPVAPPAEPST